MATESEGQQSHPMQESWVELSQQSGGRGEEGEENLVHSRSQEQMEQLLASAVSEEEQSPFSPTQVQFSVAFTPSSESQVPQQADSSRQQGERAVMQRTRPVSKLRFFSLRGLRLFGSDILMLFPVLLATHLAFFGLGFYIGRRLLLVRSI